MKISKSIIINRPIDALWQLVAHEFDQAHRWMGPIPHSQALGLGESHLGAPMQGRICDLSQDPNGAKVKEVITAFSEADKSLSFDVLPVNNPAIVPIKQNHVRMSLIAAGQNRTQVIWTASPQLKPLAYLFYPLLRLVFPVAFGKLLQGLKQYSEQQQPGV